MKIKRLVYQDCDYRYGFHCKKYKTLTETVKNVVDSELKQQIDSTFNIRSYIDLQAFQIYIANSRSWNPPTFDVDDILAAGKLLKKSGVYMCIHGSLLYNMCGSVKGTKDVSFKFRIKGVVNNLTAELDIAAALGVGVVVHIGSCKNKQEGIQTISKVITRVLTKKTVWSEQLAEAMGISQSKFIKSRKIILENAAGEGTKLGVTLEEIRDIIVQLPSNIHSQTKVCIDTAHAFGAGIYDWGKKDEVIRFYNDFEKIVGIKHLEVFHFNDSKVKLGSKKDRHEQLTEGFIFSGEVNGDGRDRTEGLLEFLSQAYERGIPMIGEPPVSGMSDMGTIAHLLSQTENPIVVIVEL